MDRAHPKSTHLSWHFSRVKAADRSQLLGQRGCVVWLTGLSGSGKSTIACALEEALVQDRYLSFILDGDNIRHGLNRDLGFSAEDREENIRRVGEVAALFAQAGVIAIAAFISPYDKDRQAARLAAKPDRFFEVYLDTPLQECENRDPKGLYKKARAGEISDFTGIDAPYESPESPALRLPTQDLTPPECVAKIITMLTENGFLRERHMA